MKHKKRGYIHRHLAIRSKKDIELGSVRFHQSAGMVRIMVDEIIVIRWEVWVESVKDYPQDDCEFTLINAS